MPSLNKLNINYPLNGIYTQPNRITVDKNNLTIIGTNNCIIDAQGKSGIFNVEADNVTIKNIKFINGKTENGGAVLWQGANGVVDNCIFENNTADIGGAIYTRNNLNIKNSNFSNNKTKSTILSLLNSNNLVFTFTGNENYINAIYAEDNAEITFENVTYWNGTTVVNSDTQPPVRLDNKAGINITIEIYNSTNDLVQNVTKTTNADGQVIYDYTSLGNGKYSFIVYHNDDIYYSYINTSEFTVADKCNIIVLNNQTVNTAENNIITINATIVDANNNTLNPNDVTLIFILPNGTEITATNSNGIWSADYTFTQPGSYLISARLEPEQFNYNNIYYSLNQIYNGTINVKNDTYTIDLNVTPGAEGANTSITVKVPADTTGTITININGKEYPATKVSDGNYSASININPGSYKVNASLSNDPKYIDKTSESKNINVPKINLNDITVTVTPGTDETKTVIAVNVPKDFTGNITLNINGTEHAASRISDGIYTAGIDINPGTYTVNASLSNDPKYNDKNTENQNFEVKASLKFSSIQNIINSAEVGAVIFLNGETYIGNGSEISINKKLTIYGGSNASDKSIATLDAKGLSRIFNITSEDVTLIGIKFTNGKETSQNGGGAIYWEGDNGNITECSFENNTADYYGGAISWWGSNGKITASTFKDNTALSGGAIDWVYSVNGTVSECSFTNNAADYYGGAIDWVYSVNGTVSDCNFTDNRAEIDGGAIAWYISDEGTVSGCSFTNNAGNEGGAVCWNGQSGIIGNCTFTNNNAIGHGGALYWNATSGLVDNCTFIKNSENSGGALYWMGAYGVVNNCTFTGNTANYGGGAIQWGNTTGTVKNSNFKANSVIYSGGALFWNGDGDNGSLVNCTFTQNTAFSGGAVGWCGANGNVVNCTFINNNATDSEGGAIYWFGDSGVLSNCTFRQNHADYNGGAIYNIKESNTVISNCTFRENTAENGGAIYWEDGENTTVVNCTFESNSADNGGAIYWNEDDATIDNCNFKENTASGNGEAVNIAKHANVEIKDSTFTDNGGSDDYSIYSLGKLKLDNDSIDNLIYTEKLDAKITVSSGQENRFAFGENVTLYITLEDDFAMLNGTVTLIVNDAPVNVTVSDGEANFTISGLNPGEYPVVAIFNEDTDHKSSYASSTFVVLNPDSRLSVKVTDIAYGETAVVNITLTDGKGIPLYGTVRVTVNGKETLVEVTDGSVLLNISDLPVGDNYLVNASFSGDYFNSEAVNDSVSFKVSKAVIDKIEIKGSEVYYGQNATVTVILPDNAEGSVSVQIEGVNGIFTASVIDGVATVQISGLKAGEYNIVVVKYSGDDKYSQFTLEDTSQYVVVNIFDVAVTNPENSTDTVFTIKTADDAKGYLIINIGGRSYAGEVVNAKASVTVSGLVPGNYTADAAYSGDGKYSAVNTKKTFTVASNIKEDVLTVPESSQTTSPTFEIRLPSDATGYLTVEIDSKKYIAVVDNGYAKISASVSEGIHNVSVSYSGDGKYSVQRYHIKCSHTGL